MRTRCPVCNTVFRVTSEQLRLKAGKVRCGHCQAIFNAYDDLLPETLSSEESPVASAEEPMEGAAEALSGQLPEASTPSEWTALLGERSPAAQDIAAVPDVAEVPLEADAESEVAAVSELRTPVDEVQLEVFPEIAADVYPDLPAPDGLSVQPPPEPLESADASRLAAREAGLVAARELNDAPSYNRWAAGTLAGSGLGGFEGDVQHRAVWPFVIFSLLLTVILLGQLAYHFRTEVVQRWPSAAGLFEIAAVDLPLPRNSEMVVIETSDLQSDNARGLFVLRATLRNRASHPQAWPALELTLTDTNDTVVSRRVLMASDYLPPASDPSAFPANGEIAVKLWIEAKDIGAAGYRLYIFYP